MTEAFKWQHLTFKNGSNPYICKTKESFDFMKRKYDMKQIKYGMWLVEHKKTRDERCEYGGITYANACYTGGGIYVYYGNLSDGTFFRTCTDLECIEIVDEDASVDNVDADYQEFYEAHRIGTLIGREYVDFWNEMLRFIIREKPNGNYLTYDLEKEFIPFW